MIAAGIIGAAGYTGGELLRLLHFHPRIKITALVSSSQAGKSVAAIHTDLGPHIDMCFVDHTDLEALDVIFLCGGHGRAKEFLHQNNPPSHLKIIDLSHDFRINPESHGFVYGLTEVFRSRIVEAQRIANPGCFATAIQLGIAPLAKHKLITQDIHVSAITGSTGAGQSLSPNSHFSWRSHNASVYKSFNHQHVAEINQTIHELQPSFNKQINFIPMRGAFTRGILASIHCQVDESEAHLQQIYKDYYRASSFVYIADNEPDLKQVVNSNFCFLSIKKHSNYVHIVSVIDNLIKGAVGQALQNCNLACGLAEHEGLHLKPSVF